MPEGVPVNLKEMPRYNSLPAALHVNTVTFVGILNFLQYSNQYSLSGTGTFCVLPLPTLHHCHPYRCIPSSERRKSPSLAPFLCISSPLPRPSHVQVRVNFRCRLAADLPPETQRTLPCLRRLYCGMYNDRDSTHPRLHAHCRPALGRDVPQTAHCDTLCGSLVHDS